MANEGSTKPTEEPFVTLSYGGTFTAKNVEDALRGAQAELDKANAELARVRGLLQRQWISVEGRLPEQVGHYLTAATMFKDETVGSGVAELSWDGSEWRELRNLLPMSTFGSKVTHWRELPEPPQGAESADIGKLDSVDKSGRCKLLDGSTRVCELGTFACSVIHDMSLDDQFKGMATDKGYQAEAVTIEKEFANSDWEALLAGSAETGGEKAVPQSAREFYEKNYANCFDGVCISPEELFYFADTYAANFHRSSQNQTVSSGVEGAHEGITADKNEYDESTDFCEKLMSSSLAPTRIPQLRESREPEKLNNAQNEIECCPVCAGIDRSHFGFVMGTRDKRCTHSWHNSVALAESSLSSPPPDYENDPAHRQCVGFADWNALLYEISKFYAKIDPEWADADIDQMDEFDPWEALRKLEAATFRQSSSLINRGAESAHSGKQNTADKSELLPTQLPNEK